jgi:PAS domain S-box-containing protein
MRRHALPRLSMRSGRSLTDQSVLGLIWDHCPDLVALLDVNGLIIYANAAHQGLLGRSAESLLGVMVFDVVHPDDAAALERELTATGKNRRPFRFRTRWLSEDGNYVALDCVGKWVVADGGSSEYILLCSRETVTATGDSSVGVPPSEVRADAARLLARAEGEKNQVARAIHDNLGQKLTALNLELALWKTELDAGQSKSVNAIREKIAVLGELLTGVIHSTRQVTSILRPRVLEEFGLAAALEWHLEKVQKQTGVTCSFCAVPQKLEVDSFIAAQLFRIAEEVVEARVIAGAKSLHVRAFAEANAVALAFEDGGRDRRLTPDILARVRLLGGECSISPEEKTILIGLPSQVGR